MRPKRTLPVASFLLGGSLLLGIGVLAQFAPAQLGNNQGNGEVESGEMLLHGQKRLAYDVSYSMPLAAISSAYLFGHAGLTAGRWLWSASVVVLFVLIFSFGLLLGGWIAGTAATVLLLPYAPVFIRYPINTLYVIAVLLVAGLLVRQACKPTLGNSVLLGLALGLSLLQRSPLIFFPLVLIVFNALSRRAPQGGAKQALAIFVIPFLFLLPWIAMNWMLYGEFVPLERGRIDGLLLNAVGSVQHISGASNVGLDGSRGGLGGALVSMTGGAIHDPWSYLSSSVQRFFIIVTAHPLLWLMAGSGFLFGLQRREYRGLGLLIVYFTAIHSAIGADEAYLLPLWPLLAALAGSAIPVLLGRSETTQSHMQKLASRLFVVCLVPTTLAGIFALGAAAAYPHRSATPSPVVGSRREAWLLLEDGRANLVRGEIAAAREAFLDAVALRPADTRIAFYLAWSQALQGHPEALLRIDSATLKYTLVRDYGLNFLKAAEYLRRGQRELAHAEIKAGLKKRPKGSQSSLLVDLAEFTRPMSASHRERLFRALVAVAPAEPLVDVRLALAQLADERGARAQARDDLASLERLKLTLTDVQSHRVIALHRKLKNRARALVRIDTLIQRSPGDAALRIERAELAAALGQRREALESLVQAESLRPEDKSQLRRILNVYRLLNAPPQAPLVQAVAPRVKKIPPEPGVWLLRAESAVKINDLTGARKFLARAEALALTDDQRRRVVALHRKLKNGARALAVLEELIRRFPGDSGLLIERGELAEENGHHGQALESLERAGALETMSEVQRHQIMTLYRRLREFERLKLFLETLIRRRPDDALLWLEKADLATETGDLDAARKALARIEDLQPDDSLRRRVALIYARAKDYRRALKLSTALVRTFPKDPEVWIMHAEFAEKSAERRTALTALSRAESLVMSDEQKRRSAVLYRTLKNDERAAAIYDELLRRFPQEADLLIARGKLAAEMGRPNEARALLARAEARPSSGAGQDGEQLRSIALAYQNLKEYDRAINILTGLTKTYPAVAAFYSDKALCEHLKGMDVAALADLQTAITLEPKFLPAYLTLGAIHTTRGRMTQALTVYDTALSKTTDADPLRALVLAAREDIASKIPR